MLLAAEPLSTLVNDHVLGGDTFFFDRTPAARTTLEAHLHQELNLRADQLRIVGSAHAGFSLSPDSFSRPFSPASDIDVLVVDESTFDALWIALLRWHYGLPARRVPDAAWDGVNKIYWGWIAPARLVLTGLTASAQLRSVQDHRTRWFNAFQSLSRTRPFARWHVTARLYRTWDHARLYHVDSLRKLKLALGEIA